MKLLALLVALSAVVALCHARPDFGDVLGMDATPDPSRPLHYEYSGTATHFDDDDDDTQKRSLSNTVSSLIYDADLQPGVHSFDIERTIDELSCSETFVDVTVTNAAPLNTWGQSFVFVAGKEWGCKGGIVIRRVSSVHWLSPLVARLMTTPAEYEDVFETAKIHFTLQKPSAAPAAVNPRGKPIVFHPSVPRASWNKNRKTGGANAPITFWKAGCGNCAANPGQPLCQLCPRGVQLENRIGCDGCWADAGINTVTLKIEFSFRKFIVFEFEVFASSQVEIGSLGITAAAGGQWAQTIPVFGAPLFPGSGLSFTVAGHQFNFVATVIKAGSKLLPLNVINGDMKASVDISARLRQLIANKASPIWKGPVMSKLAPALQGTRASAEDAQALWESVVETDAKGSASATVFALDSGWIINGVNIARPDFSDVLGMDATSDPDRPLHYEYSGTATHVDDDDDTQKRSLSNTVSSLIYDADLQPGVHSFDTERTIDELSCSETFVDVTVTNAATLKSWGQRFVFVAGKEWGCKGGVVIRRVSSVHWLSPLVARLTTTPAEYEDVFESAKIHFTLQKPRAPASSAIPRGKPIVFHPSAPRASWNKNRQTGQASAPITFWKAGCDNCAGQPLCQLCARGVQLESRVGCDGCWADAGINTVTLKVLRFRLLRSQMLTTTTQIEFSFRKFIVFEFEVFASSQVEIGSLGVTAGAGGQWSRTIALAGVPLFPGSGLSFTVAGHQFNFGALFKLDAVLNFNAEADGRMTMSYSKIVDLHFYGNTGSKQATATASMRDGPSGNKVDAGVKAEFSASAGLRAGLTLEVSKIAEMSAWVQPTVEATAKFAYPAFDPLRTTQLVPGGLHLGRCNQFHLGEVSSDIAVYVGASARVMKKDWSSRVVPLGRTPLASGCIFGVASKFPLGTRVAHFGRTIESLVPGLSLPALNAAISHEIASVLRVPDSSVATVIKAGSRLLPLNVINGDMKASVDISAKLRNLMANRQSRIWKGPVMSKLAPALRGTRAAEELHTQQDSSVEAD
eukprot:m51a1_g3561 hypothetical protein (1027) ;mRNA; r:1050059-1056225